MLIPHSPAAVSLPTCIHPAELHSHSQAAFTSPMQPNQPNKPTICIPTHSFAHRGAPSQMRACTRPVHLFDAQRSCSNVLHGAAHNQNLRCCTHPALRPTSAAFRAATARGACTPALTVGVHPASSNERAECDCPGRPWRWLHPTYHPPRDVSFSRSRRQYNPQLVVGLRHRLPCIYLLHIYTEQRHRPTAAHSKKSGATYELTSRCTAQMCQFVGWCDGVAVCTRSRMPFTRRRSRGYFRDSGDFRDSAEGIAIVGIFATPQKVCREMSLFYTMKSENAVNITPGRHFRCLQLSKRENAVNITLCRYFSQGQSRAQGNSIQKIDEKAIVQNMRRGEGKKRIFSTTTATRVCSSTVRIAILQYYPSTEVCTLQGCEYCVEEL